MNFYMCMRIVYIVFLASVKVLMSTQPCVEAQGCNKNILFCYVYDINIKQSETETIFAMLKQVLHI